METDKHVIYAAWAPAGSPWSRWAKPAVFAHIPADLELRHPPVVAAGVSMYPAAHDRRALVIDLPGTQAVATGLGLARCGYRPVPLFNACPPAPEDVARMIGTAVDTRAVLEALVTSSPELAGLGLPASAPPAFLLDAQRQAPGVFVGERMFDNRSVVFPADFPSATFLRNENIRRAGVVHDPALPVGDDLRYALRHWIAEGIRIDAVTPTGEPFDIAWPSDGIIGEIMERMRALFTLRRNPTGGFGRFVPEASGG
jgi:hypothetical protein